MSDDLKQALEHIRAFVSIQVRQGQLSIDHDKISKDIDAAKAFLTRLSSVQEVEPEKRDATLSEALAKLRAIPWDRPEEVEPAPDAFATCCFCETETACLADCNCKMKRVAMSRYPVEPAQAVECVWPACSGVVDDGLPCVCAPTNATAELSRLRKALIECGRNAGAFLADEVSTDFLMLIPAEVAARMSELSRQRLERDAVIEECEAAISWELLTDDTGDPSDEAYNCGIGDAAAAIRALKSKGAAG